MTIPYVLVENNLTSDPNDYYALVKPAGSADLDDIVERIEQQGSTVTRADIYSVLEDYFAAVETLLVEGNTVNTPVANYTTSIKGVFDGPDENFDASRHHLRPIANPGTRIRKTLRQRGQPIKQEAVTPRPNPVEYIDINSDTRNSILTPGGMGRISGHRLQFDAATPEQGVFFVAEDGTETRVDVVGRNKPSELVFMVPDSLADGDYTLEVRAYIYGGNDLRTGALDTPLTVS